MTWKLKSDRPIYLQLMSEITLRIISGAYKPGEKLLSVRDLAGEAAVNPNTMQKALSELEKGGLILSQRTSGRYVTEDVNMIQTAKESLAKELIGEFFERMESLGLKPAEAVGLATKLAKEREK